MKSKYKFICIKGFGDLVVCINAILTSKYVNCSIVVSRRNLSLAQLLVNDQISIDVIDEFDYVPSFYNLRKNFKTIIKDTFILRREVSRINKEGFIPVFDMNSVRLRLMLVGIKYEYLPSTKNIYESYENYLNFVFKPLFNIIKNKEIYIFPFGSDISRCMRSDYLAFLTSGLKKYNIQYKILVHQSQIILVDDSILSETIIFNNFSTLLSFIKFGSAIITVDSVALHLAKLNNLSIYVCTNSWLKFIPDNILRSGRIFPINTSSDIINTIVKDLNVI